jgi:hypothetical protein
MNFKSAGGAKECSPGREPGVTAARTSQPRRGVRGGAGILRPSGAVPIANTNPGLTPGATLFRASGAFTS